MAQMYPCFECNGTGQVDGGTCPRCSGSGELRADWIKIGILGRDAIMDKLDEIETKIDILVEDLNP